MKSGFRAALGRAQRLRCPNLADDNRGAIAIAGVFMALFLIGALWYVVGIGDAILFRERVQDGTDAVAFTSAVYHARTMNLIASLNIVISVLLGLLIAAKIIHALNTTLFAVSSVCAPIPFTAPVCGPILSVTAPLRGPLETLETQTQNMYDLVGPAINVAQHVAALTGPWYAQYKSVRATEDYQPDLAGGFTVGISLVPGLAGSKRIALPVQKGTPVELCDRTSEGIVNLLFRPFGTAGRLVRDWVGDAFVSAVSSFCDDGGKAFEEAQEEFTDDKVEDAAKDFCEWEEAVATIIHVIRRDYMPAKQGNVELQESNREWLEKLYRVAHETNPERGDRNLHRCYTSPITHIFEGRPRSTDMDTIGERETCYRPRRPYDFNQCMKRMRKHYRDKLEDARNDAQEEAPAGHQQQKVDTVPYVLFDEAEAGDGHFSVFAFTWADTTRVTDDSKIVAVADHSRQRPKDKVESFAANSIARAEFFYDGDYDPIESMWNLRWRASMRRFWPPEAESLPVFGALLESDAFKSLQEQLSDVLETADNTELQGGMKLLLGDELAKQVKDDAQQAQRWVNDPEGMAWAHYGAIH